MNDEQTVTKMLINPYYAIEIDPNLATKHEPLITDDVWVDAQKRLIGEMGLEAWLHELLKVLQGDYPVSNT